MLFHEPLFLLLFLPTVLTAFLLTQAQAGRRAAVLLGASVLFYSWIEPLFVPVVLTSCVADYMLAKAVSHGRHWALPAGIAMNLGMLGYYKYAGFAISNLNATLEWAGAGPVRLLEVALPVGVSFIVFEKITYLVDVSRRVSQPAPRFTIYLLYVFLFPKLLAGPIVKYHEIEAQLLAFRRDHASDLMMGFRRFMLGMVKKVLLADTLASGADAAFNANPASLTCVDAWRGVLFFTFQIYFDFSAYSDMAIGLAQMFGFQLDENFDRPYISRSVTEFWRRWHISLTSWIREYLYIPLGGNRVPLARQYLNLWICFLLSGLWHGAAWTFVLWGAYNGLFLMLDRLFLLRWLSRLPQLAASAATFTVTMGGWLLFRAASLGQAGTMLSVMLQPGHGVGSGLRQTAEMQAAVAMAGLISFMPLVPGFDRAAAVTLRTPGGRAMLDTLLALLFVFALAKVLADPFMPFLYFRF